MPNILHGSWRQHVVLDVGTAMTRLAAGQAPSIERPSCIGNKRALRDGVVVDGETVQHILKPLLDRSRVFGIIKPHILTCAPSDASQEERQLLIDSVMNSGAASVSLIPEPLAAAIGAGIDVSSRYAQGVIDMGAGVTDCAVIRSSKIFATCAIRTGCDQMRQAIVTAAQEVGDAHISEAFADELLRTCGLTRSATLPGSFMTAAALHSVLEEIAGAVDLFLRGLPDDVGCEIIESGVTLTGGGALIPGMLEYLEQRTGIKVTVASNPRAAVIEGARAILPVIQVLNQWR